jgi:hypothetical protein
MHRLYADAKSFASRFARASQHDSPDLNGPGSYTGYAVQTGGTQVGFPN